MERQINDGDMLDCGHAYVRPVDSLGTGYARTHDSRVICYDHADDEQRADLAKADQFTAYVNSEGREMITWSGGHLGWTMQHRISRAGFNGSEIHSWQFTTPSGTFYGRNGGPGMVITVKRAKS